MSDVRLGFIGTGGNMNRHLRELTQIGGNKFVAFCDIVIEKAERAVEQYGGKAYADYNEMLAKEELDAVYISIPPFAHGAPEKAVVAAGLPMFVEKPVHMDADEAKEIAAQVEDKGIITACGYQERYLDIIDKAQELLASRRVGFFMGYWRWVACPADGGVRKRNLVVNSWSRRHMNLIWRAIFLVKSKPFMPLQDLTSFLIPITILRKRLLSLCNLRVVCLALCSPLALQPMGYGVPG
jgi:predicted dehydrogenase